MLVKLSITVLSHGLLDLPCQLMVGFYAYAKTLEINVDKEELEDAKWHSREDVKKALTLAEYKNSQETAVAKVEQMCKGVEKGQLVVRFQCGKWRTCSYVHTWAFCNCSSSDLFLGQQVVLNGVKAQKQATGSLSNL